MLLCAAARAQSIGSGTVGGAVLDPSGAAIPGASVTLRNPVNNYGQQTATDATGSFRFNNVPLNSYRLQVNSSGFDPFEENVAVQSSVPLSLNVKLKLAGAQTILNVEGGGAAIVENVPVAHNDVDTSMLATLPTGSPGSGLSDAIAMSAPGVVADSNGFFHPLGDHAQTSFYVDGQPINDQQSKMFSTQMPANAFQNMELITGMAQAEFGDKTSLVVDAVTRSGLGRKPFGEFEAGYGSFGNATETGSIGWGSSRFGNFLVVNADRSGRFLDTPEFYPNHDEGQ